MTAQRFGGASGRDNNAIVREELRRVNNVRGTLWEDVLLQHCLALAALVAGKPSEAYQQLVAYTQPFLQARLSSPHCWDRHLPRDSIDVALPAALAVSSWRSYMKTHPGLHQF